MPSFRRIEWPVSLLIAVAFTVPARAGIEIDHYNRGNEALARKDWPRAVEEFTEAIQVNGASGKIRSSGMFVVGYYPYLGLGIAYFNLGRYDVALKALETEQRLGAIQSSPDHLRELESIRRLATLAMEHDASRPPASGAPPHPEPQTQREVTVAPPPSAPAATEAAPAGRAAVGATVPPPSGGAPAPLDRGVRESPATPTRPDEQVSAPDHIARLKQMLAEAALRATRQADELLNSGRAKDAVELLSSNRPIVRDDAVRAVLDRSLAATWQQVHASPDPKFVAAHWRELVEFLDRTGRANESLEVLRSVTAFDPEDHAAAAVLLARNPSGVDQAGRTDAVRTLIEDALADLKRGDYERSVMSLNEAIALDPKNLAARDNVAKAYALLSRSLPAPAGGSSSPRQPPVIALANQDITPEEGHPTTDEAVEHVTTPDVLLSGAIFDDQPLVKLSITTEAPPDQAGASPHTVYEADLSGTPLGNLYRFSFAKHVSFDQATARFLIVATDLDGLRSEARHSVRFDRPWSRAPWLYVTIGLVALGAVGGYRGYTTHRRKTLLKRRFNPYIAGAPVLDDDLFVGREALLVRILQSLHNNSILLFGERRIGKTTLQHHLKKRLERLNDPEIEFFPVYIDLQGTPQERFFRLIAHELFEELAPAIARTRPDPRTTEGDPYDYHALVGDIRNLLKLLKTRTPKKVRLVLLIDEVDELNGYDPSVNQRFRSLFMRSFAADLVAVVSGVRINKHWATEGSPWYNFFEEIEVMPFTRDDARELIERPVRSVFELEAGVVDRLVERTGCRPYLIQRTCIALVNRLHDDGRRKIRLADVDAVGISTDVVGA